MRCGQALLDFLSSTDVGRLVPPLEEEGNAGSEVSEGSSGSAGSGKRSGRLRQRCWVPRMRWAPKRDFRCSFPHPLSWHRQVRTRGQVARFFRSFLC